MLLVLSCTVGVGAAPPLIRFLHQLLGINVSEGVLTALRPDRLRRWFHERYLPEEKVLSLQSMPRPAFSFTLSRCSSGCSRICW